MVSFVLPRRRVFLVFLCSLVLFSSFTLTVLEPAHALVGESKIAKFVIRKAAKKTMSFVIRDGAKKTAKRVIENHLPPATTLAKRYGAMAKHSGTMHRHLSHIVTKNGKSRVVSAKDELTAADTKKLEEAVDANIDIAMTGHKMTLFENILDFFTGYTLILAGYDLIKSMITGKSKQQVDDIINQSLYDTDLIRDVQPDSGDSDKWDLLDDPTVKPNGNVISEFEYKEMLEWAESKFPNMDDLDNITPAQAQEVKVIATPKPDKDYFSGFLKFDGGNAYDYGDHFEVDLNQTSSYIAQYPNIGKPLAGNVVNIDILKSLVAPNGGFGGYLSTTIGVPWGNFLTGLSVRTDSDNGVVSLNPQLMMGGMLDRYNNVDVYLNGFDLNDSLTESAHMAGMNAWSYGSIQPYYVGHETELKSLAKNLKNIKIYIPSREGDPFIYELNGGGNQLKIFIDVSNYNPASASYAYFDQTINYYTHQQPGSNPYKPVTSLRVIDTQKYSSEAQPKTPIREMPAPAPSEFQNPDNPNEVTFPNIQEIPITGRDDRPIKIKYPPASNPSGDAEVVYEDTGEPVPEEDLEEIEVHDPSPDLTPDAPTSPTIPENPNADNPISDDPENPDPEPPTDPDNGQPDKVNWKKLRDIPALLTTKFPFSLPWDLLYYVQLLNAEPVQPVLKADTHFGDMPVKFEKRLDYGEEYMPFFRGFLIMGYSMMLIMATRRLMGGGV